MNRREIHEDWEKFTTVLRTYWPRLTADDLGTIEGSRERLAGALEERYGWQEVEVERRIAEFEKDARYPGAVK